MWFVLVLGLGMFALGFGLGQVWHPFSTSSDSVSAAPITLQVPAGCDNSESRCLVLTTRYDPDIKDDYCVRFVSDENAECLGRKDFIFYPDRHQFEWRLQVPRRAPTDFVQVERSNKTIKVALTSPSGKDDLYGIR